MNFLLPRFLGLPFIIVVFGVSLPVASYSAFEQALQEYRSVDDSPPTESVNSFGAYPNNVTERSGTDFPSISIGEGDGTVIPEVTFNVFNTEDSIDESTPSISVPITLNEEVTADLAVKYGIGGTATSGQDYTIDNAGVVTVDVSNDRSQAEITISIIDDNIYEGDKTIILTLTNGTGYTVGSTFNTYTLTIIDDEDPHVPEFFFDSGSGNVRENVPSVNVKVNINHPPTEGGLNLYFVPGEGETATVNVDYSYDLDFRDIPFISVPPNVSSLNIPLRIIPDNLDEGNETIIIALLPETHLGGIYTLGTPNTHTLTIIDNDGTVTTPDVTFASTSSSVAEDTGTHNVAVNLSPAAPAGGLTLNYSLGGTATRNTDYTSSGTVPVTAGATSVNIPVMITEDNDDETEETIILTLTSGTGYTVGNANIHTLTITDNDGTVATPEVAFASTSSSVAEDAGTHNIAVNLSPAAPAGGLTLDYTIGGTATGGSDYTSLSGTVDVTVGATSVNIPITVTDDNDDETDETIILTLTSGTGYTVGSANVHTLTITDNDETVITPEVAFASTSNSVAEDAGTQNVAVNLSPAAPAGGVTLNYTIGGTATGGSDYTSLSGTVDVTAGATSVNIPVVITDDSADEGDETIILTLTSGTGYTVGSANIHTLAITDNDGTALPAVAFASTSGSVDEDAGAHNVIVNIVPAPQAALTLSYSLSGTAVEGEDYSIRNSGTIAVTAGETSVNIPVMITDDSADEEAETIILTLTSSAGYEVGSVNVHTLTITDNDTTPEAAFYSASASVAEDAGTHSVAARIRPAPESDLTLTYGLEGTAKEEADYSITNSGSISVEAGVDSVNIAIKIADDREDESDETVILTLTDGVGYNVGSMKGYTLTITDNDATATLSVSPNPVSEGEEVTVMVTLSEAASNEISIPIVLTAGTAEEGDYGALSAIVINKDERIGTGMIVTSLDSDLDDETFTITFGTLPAGLTAGTQASVEVTITDAGERTSVESLGKEIPTEFSLAQNYPNPFNPSTAIEFSLTRTGQVTLTVYDMLGQKVRTLLEGIQPAGRHSVLFNGVGLASDTYIYVLQTEQHRAVKMMTLLK